MVLLKNMAQALERSFTNAGRSRARDHLLRQSDRVLADAGFSRELLESGNGAWPWRHDGAATDGASGRAASFVPAGATSTGVVPFPALDEAALAGPTDRDGRKAA